MEHAVRQLFEQYERLFNQALHGQADLEALTALYAPEMIGAAPAGGELPGTTISSRRL